MSIALFKSMLHTDEGEKVWGAIRQKVVEEAESATHVAEGWFESAADALESHKAAQTEAENAALQSQIDDATKKLDGRTKAARDAKAAEQSAP